MIEVQVIGAAVGGLLCGAGLSTFYYQKKLQREVDALKDFKGEPAVQEVRVLLTETISKLNNLQNAYAEDLKVALKGLERLLSKSNVSGVNLSDLIKEAEKTGSCQFVAKELRRIVNELKKEAVKERGPEANDEELIELIKKINEKAALLSKWTLPASIRDKNEVGKLVVEVLRLTKEAYEAVKTKRENKAKEL